MQRDSQTPTRENNRLMSGESIPQVLSFFLYSPPPPINIVLCPPSLLLDRRTQRRRGNRGSLAPAPAGTGRFPPTLACSRSVGGSGAAAEEVHNLVEAELEELLLGAAFDGRLGKQALLLLQVKDALLDRLFDCEFVDDHVDGLGQPVDAVDGLFFDELKEGSSQLTFTVGRDRDRRKEERNNIQDSRTARE